ncbi:STAS domain-containing protein [Nocardia sp. NPDC057353]|uniref:STAS domain-containing protein n=1 Tax=Nocardia sp. NPDC057353 TaxID=3346104 RepID=UPI00362A51F0
MDGMGQQWSGFEIATEPREAAVVVTASGEVDMVTAARLREALDRAQDPSGLPTVLDLSRIEFFDSSGLEVLVDVHHRARLRVVASAAVRRPLGVTGLDRVLDVYDDLAAALAD